MLFKMPIVCPFPSNLSTAGLLERREVGLPKGASSGWRGTDVLIPSLGSLLLLSA